MKRLNFPNMVHDCAMFTFNNLDGCKYDLKIFNISGEEIYSRELDGRSGFMFDRGNLISGVYFIQVTDKWDQIVCTDTLILN